ncbi:hypothetical protein [Anditalea andensis]|uniref:Uncharacterized protein n=1 Tax=Anditalea andensis TaxID=1048983 RepID=A0A074L5Z8_9BACT|nr:hypothetical protein [Anditalea andensis]KEO75925.1 hypothetical protein EL17_10950 [Anditalea andensis]
MITAVIGRTFLKAFNVKYAKALTPKEFFEQEYWELFYNHNKYLMSGGNSPFENPKISWGRMLSGSIPFESELKRIDRFEKFIEKAENTNGILDASIAMGFPASDTTEFASTSGLVSDVLIPADEDEVYLSWIGSGLGIGVAGGFTILFDNPTITLQTFEGWKVYRKYLNDPTLEKLRGNQINTWNGQWLTYSLNAEEYREDFDFSELTNQKIFKVETSLAEVSTVTWSQLFFSLSTQFPNDEMMGYVYGFGQTNKTIGFIPFQFKSGSRLKDVYKQLFEGVYSDPKQFESLFGMHIKRACELGSIGLKALRPDSLKKYMTEEKNLTFKKEEDTINYQAYKTWLVAMLTRNKEEITDYTLELAKTILKYRAGGTKLDRKTLIEKELFSSTSKRGFIEALTKMVKDLDGDELVAIKSLKDEVHLMTNEEYGYFSTLLKFDYAFIEKKS